MIDRLQAKPLSSILRASAWVVIIFGLLLYGFWLYLCIIEWRQSTIIHQSFLKKFEFIFLYAIIGGGLNPLIITIYFLGMNKDLYHWLFWLMAFPAIIIIHILYFSALSHGHSTLMNVCMLVAEILATIIIIMRDKYRGQTTLNSNKPHNNESR